MKEILSFDLRFAFIMYFNYIPPSKPKYVRNFSEQFNYIDYQISTENYTEKPTVLNPANSSNKFENFIKNENTQKVGKLLIEGIKSLLQCS